jgi:hypothetical protein
MMDQQTTTGVEKSLALPDLKMLRKDPTVSAAKKWGMRLVSVQRILLRFNWVASVA